MRLNLRHKLAALVGVALLSASFLGASKCDPNVNAPTDPNAQRRESIENRSQTFARATNAAPVPKTNNFPLRKALVEMTERQDRVGVPYYVYVLGMNGNVVGYYVSKTTPVNSCAFLSSTEEVRTYDSNDGAGFSSEVLTAPSLDGIYYGGAGASAGCDSWFFFDQASDAMITIRGVAFFVADKPLRLQAQAITVEAVGP